MVWELEGCGGVRRVGTLNRVAEVRPVEQVEWKRCLGRVREAVRWVRGGRSISIHRGSLVDQEGRYSPRYPVRITRAAVLGM